MSAARLQRCSSLAGALRSASQWNCSLRTQSRMSYQIAKRRILLKSCKISRATPAKKLPTKHPRHRSLRRSPRYLRRSSRLQGKQGIIPLKVRKHPAGPERGIEALLPCPKKAKIVLPRDESGFHSSLCTGSIIACAIVTGQDDASYVQECDVCISSKDQCPDTPLSSSTERLSSDEGEMFETSNYSPKAPALPPAGVNLDDTVPVQPMVQVQEDLHKSSLGSPLCPVKLQEAFDDVAGNTSLSASGSPVPTFEVPPMRSATPTLSLTRTLTCTFLDPSL